MKLTDTTDTGSKTPLWEYSKTQIPTTDITQLRFAVYDNGYNPDSETQLKHLYEPKRYRGEIQVWTGSDKRDSDYKLFNYFSNYKTFKNNKWKDSNDPYKDWYVTEVDRAKCMAEEYGSEFVVCHANLGLPKAHAGRSDGSYGFYNMPQWSMHLIINNDVCFIKCNIEKYCFDLELNNSSISTQGTGAKLYYRKMNVSQ